MKDLDIKKIWQEGNEESSFSYTNDKIDIIIKKNPQNIVQKFQKTVVFELWFNAITITAAAIYTAFLELWVFALLIFILDVGLFIYYKDLSKKLKIRYINSNVVSYLNETHAVIKKFMRFYKILTTILIFPGLFYGMYLSDSEIIKSGEIWSLKYLVLLFIAAILVILIAHFCIYLMYGKKANKIKSIVEMLKSEE